MAKKPPDFDERETATIGACLHLIRVVNSRYRAGSMDAAAKALGYLESNYSILQRNDAIKVYDKRRKRA
jgi:hypothetical protein